ncbi:hypothetical protein RHGRI_006515 [Rhododendron griersonianum]|uniref:Uncharacterized protein n=1 Tax=Rhododendron griersonianum TaxID=479676 RepID=A0AAV6KTT2_9ERIC|nr:hypothetical protein RHGRI_006515 [Rhododendron griersonianum]
MPAFCLFWFAASVAWEAGKPLVIKEVEVAPPHKMEVCVKILFNTLCHTDIYFWEAKIIHTLSVSLNKVGDLKYYDEDLQGARSYYFQSLNVRRDAIKNHPSSPSQVGYSDLERLRNHTKESSNEQFLELGKVLGLSLEAAAGRDTKPTLTYSVPSPSLSKARSETDGIAETGASSSSDRTDLVTTACLPPKLSILLQETSEIEVLLSLFELGEVLSFVSSGARENGDDPMARSMEKPKTLDDVTDKSKPWKVAETQCQLVVMPDSTNEAHKVARLLYRNGCEVLALGCNGALRLWRRYSSKNNQSGMATASVFPLQWQPASGLAMTNDVTGVNLEEAVPCMALSKNYSKMMILACGGKVSLFNIETLEVRSELKGHEKRITGLAFSTNLKILVSSGADAQLCIWRIDTWEHLKSVPIELPAGKASYSCDSQLVYTSFCDGNIGVFDADSLTPTHHIAPSAYSPTLSSGSHAVYPLVVATHPWKPNQFAVGLTNGSVIIIEPQESEGKWGLSSNTSNHAPDQNQRKEEEELDEDEEEEDQEEVLQSQTKVLTEEDFHMMLETDDRRVGVGGCKANISVFVLMTS